MPIIYIEGIKTTLLTLFGFILGFIGGKVDTALNNNPFITSPSEFTNFQIQLPLISIFTYVRSRRDQRRKIAGTDPDNTILYYTILYYTILYYTILYYTILYYTIRLYHTILYYAILYYTIL
jgi:hypothetical protein